MWVCACECAAVQSYAGLGGGPKLMSKYLIRRVGLALLSRSAHGS